MLFGVLGPYFFEATVTEDNYLGMLKNYVVPGLMTHVGNFQEIYFNMMALHYIMALQSAII